MKHTLPRMLKWFAGVVWMLVVGPSAAALAQETSTPRLDTIVLPEGFKIGLFADSVPGAREMARGDKGTIFVGSMREGKVYAVTDSDGDHRADRVRVVAEGLNWPNGVAFRNGSLYVAEIERVTRFDDIESKLDDPPAAVVVNASFPTERHHGWKFIRFGPDGKLYVPVGAPCNICERLDNPLYASIARMNPDGSGLEVFASGVRNTVGFAWHPVTGDLWFSDNGRDNLGDNRPPDELNRASKPGMHFGYPYCHGGFISDPELGNKRPCADFTPPAQNLGPHVAAIGVEFYTGDQFPAEYKNQLFIAEHGSWNRSIPLGYRITLARIEGNQKVVNYEVFAEGWLQGEEAWGRPVALLQLPDGSLLVSDDKAGAIYRISHGD